MKCVPPDLGVLGVESALFLCLRDKEGNHLRLQQGGATRGYGVNDLREARQKHLKHCNNQYGLQLEPS